MLLSSEAGLYAKQASTLHWLRLIAAAGGLLRFLAVDNQSFLHGTVSLLEAMLADADADVQLSSPVHLIAQDAGGVRVSTEAGDYEARAAVVTIPPGVLRQVDFEPPLSEAKREATADSHAGTGIKVCAVVRGLPTLLRGRPGPGYRHRLDVCAGKGRQPGRGLRPGGGRARSHRPRRGGAGVSRVPP